MREPRFELRNQFKPTFLITVIVLYLPRTQSSIIKTANGNKQLTFEKMM
jgi:hypothetical protein